MKATTSFLKWNLFPVPRICKLDIKAYQAEGLRDYLLEQSLSKKRKISQLYMSVQTKTAKSSSGFQSDWAITSSSRKSTVLNLVGGGKRDKNKTI